MTRVPESSSKVDITLFGATSFVARHVLTYLMQTSLTIAPLQITLAGRNQNKLDALCEEFTTKMMHLSVIHESTSCGHCVFDTLVADAQDKTALQQMAARTKVVIACAGPFEQYGSHVVAACAAQGTDYVDITGEVSWAGRMRLLHGPTAQKSGARILSLCGFDSVPSDLAVFLAVEKLRLAAPSAHIQEAYTWHHVLGTANGGTLMTAAQMPLDWKYCWSQPVPFLLDDPLVLTHPKIRSDPSYQSTKNRLAKAEWKNQLPMFHTIFRLGASAPFFMAPINSKVVHASAVAMNYGSEFVYKERFLPTGYKMTTALRMLAIIPVIMIQIGTLLAMLVLWMPYLGTYLVQRLAPPGTGMTEEQCRMGFAKVYAEVSTAADPVTNVQDRANVMLEFQGDPGNWVTAQCVAESALALLLDKEKLPPKSEDGFGTPAQLLGHVLLYRLQHSSVRPVQISNHVRRINHSEWRMWP
ncbi:hypothetical protein FisN_17Hh127 [Fistulifera solaris]|uniref:Saccharopine dehydrogenase NADP binding domain-containing protein n=1 Tax=Fistulifera solaris TaxID=1519565 RepID=A0A1Z5JGZ6_FISSO|nr:hypothetical protein FisN_17Hh127 [Fistulifera solaris]|eukprot:GAX13196.1 hypothetical protein FisN_17Hh127 [Fistulifera solaris]